MLLQLTRWCAAAGADTYTKLWDLIALKQFRNSVSDSVTTYMMERKAQTASEAATLADEFMLIRKDPNLALVNLVWCLGMLSWASVSWAFPVDGVSLILGNDLAGQQVSVPLLVVENPVAYGAEKWAEPRELALLSSLIVNSTHLEALYKRRASSPFSSSLACLWKALYVWFALF
ncbi:hypothetical protein SKAU_G00061400 [Synaphobranchus kaupii]|uniref:Uncharacterized protein n=1 Tax=Synaphobranchus kaupii TaxID=118154 RepID=A0A9Q1G6F6_SYNKA|nr:hypothetical protein SKAU_G00061400 [Synaphobranchus kaupii]